MLGHASAPWVSWLSTSVTASIGRDWTTVPSKILRRSYDAPASPACRGASAARQRHTFLKDEQEAQADSPP